MSARAALALALTAAAVLAADGPCSSVQVCVDVGLKSECGWCWDATTTVGQAHGGRVGNSTGPTDGLGPCNDWDYSLLDCHSHVDCPSIPDCLGIAGTYCGWCGSTGTAYKGTTSGPSDPAQCSTEEWVWSHGDCKSIVGPQQIHLAWTNETEQGALVVSWADAVKAEEGSAHVVVGPAASWPESGKRYPAEWHTTAAVNTLGVKNMYVARVHGLELDTRYTYQVVSSNGIASDEYTTHTNPPVGANVSFLLFGDMGRYGGGFILRALQREVDAAMRPGGRSNLSAIIHVGDFAYDLRDDGGRNGDSFMNRIQGVNMASGVRGSLASTLPYLTAVGNHEIGSGSFDNYRARFNMPRSDINDGFDMWWSADIGLVHLVVLSSETFFARSQDNARQVAWLKADLAAANKNRGDVPWVIAMAHRPIYCSNLDGDDCTKPDSVLRAGFEDALVEGGVDIAFWAHEHSYERTWPVSGNGSHVESDYVDPKAPVHIITGFAGCNEDDGACLNPIGPPLGNWSAFRQSKEGTYTYGRLIVGNATHLHWQAVVPEESNRIEDDLWLVQHNHGPFQP